MNGSMKLSAEEIAEMKADAADPQRRRAFSAARALSQTMSFEDYIEFISDNMEDISVSPTPHITGNYLL